MTITESNVRIEELVLMSTDNISVVQDGDLNVPVDPRIDISVLKADDDNPMFVNVEVIRSGISGNRRRYGDQVVEQIGDKIVGLQGYLGHPDPNKYGFEFRDPQCIFVGAIVQTLESGLKRVIAKAYIYKSSNLREWIPKSIAAGKPLTVSINGYGDIIKNTADGVIDVVSITLESVDWANPGTEGVGTSKALSVVSEMNKNGGEQMEREEVIKGITLQEMKELNPVIVADVVKAVTVTELKEVNPELVETIKNEVEPITEMNLVVDGKEGAVKFTDVQSIIDKQVSKIEELNSAIAEMKITEYKQTKLQEVPEEYRDFVSKRVSGITEQQIDDSIKSELEYITEIAGKFGSNDDNTPRGNRERHDGGDDVAEAVKDIFKTKK